MKYAGALRFQLQDRGRLAYIVAASLSCAYAANVLIGKGNGSLGWQLPHAGDVAEFLCVLGAMSFFVIGLVHHEAAAKMPP